VNAPAHGTYGVSVASLTGRRKEGQRAKSGIREGRKQAETRPAFSNQRFERDAHRGCAGRHFTQHRARDRSGTRGAHFPAGQANAPSDRDRTRSRARGAAAHEVRTLFGPKPGASRPGLVQTPEPVPVVGNLPYYITSDILLRLFEFRQCFSTIVIMVQKEVADRLAATPGTRDYGLLSATAQLYAKVERLFTLPPGAFSPPPKVHSSVVRLTMSPRVNALNVDEVGFIDFLKLSFGQKRKTLWNNFKTEYAPDLLKEALREAGVKPTVRAETLPLEKSAAIFRALASRNGNLPSGKK
jgi:16S rRNA A1518/A1519 N6-dimethyltransferase RsmA/KsgA/DIM1 with predicted DNA glycosylase/AP lyase activity